MVTIREIAKAVGVSSATVSRVLNADATLSVTPQTRQKIIETAEALNYVTPRNRNRAAGAALKKIAFVHFLEPAQELRDPYYVAMRLGIERRCQELQVETVKVYHTDRLPEPTLLQTASGVIAIGPQSPAEVEWLKRFGRCVVCADWAPADDAFDAVLSDLAQATRSLLGELTRIGYRRIAFAGWAGEDNNDHDPLGEIRCAAYVDWMRQAGRFDALLCETEASVERNREESGYRLALRLLERPEPPDAIVTCNDNIAVGVYRAIHERGLRIPDDVAVASFNDISVAQFLNPPLSTVHLPAEEIGETAVDLLAERAAGREIVKRVTLATRAIWRRSTAVPRAPLNIN